MFEAGSSILLLPAIFFYAMNKLIFFISILTTLLFSACTDKLHERKEPILVDGVIVADHDPVWILPCDSLSLASPISELCPMPILGDEIIVTTHKNGNPGFRRLKIETGEVIWEWYMDKTKLGNELPFGAGFFSLIHRQNYFITTDNKYLVFSFNPVVTSNMNTIHTVIDIENGKLMWSKNVPSIPKIHYENGDYYYFEGINVYNQEPSEYYNHYVYRSRITDGTIEEVFRCRKMPQIAGWCNGVPFSYRGQNYMFVTEKIVLTVHPETTSEDSFGLLNLDTGDTLMWGDFNADYIDEIQDVHVHNNIIYVFKRGNYLIFDIDKLQFTDTIWFGNYSIDPNLNIHYMSDSYECHYFYKNKLVVGVFFASTAMGIPSYHDQHQEEPFHLVLPRGYLFDVSTNKRLHYIHAEHHASIMDDILYYACNHNLYAIDINTGKKLIDMPIPYCVNAASTSSVYKNSKGKKYVIVSSPDYTYCFPGL